MSVSLEEPVTPVTQADEREMRECPVDTALSVIGGRWKATILWRLSERPMRTSELRRSIPAITERMLIRHLQELVRDGVLVRIDAGTVPPHVTYEISEYGSTLAPLVGALCEWGRGHQRRIRASTHNAAPGAG